MSPPPHREWDDIFEDEDAGEDYESDLDLSEDESESEPTGHAWPDPFDTGTEVSTPPRSARSPASTNITPLPSVRESPVEHRGAQEYPTDTASGSTPEGCCPALPSEHLVLFGGKAVCLSLPPVDSATQLPVEDLPEESGDSVSPSVGLRPTPSSWSWEHGDCPLPEPIPADSHTICPDTLQAPKARANFCGDFRSCPPGYWADFHSWAACGRPTMPEAPVVQLGCKALILPVGPMDDSNAEQILAQPSCHSPSFSGHSQDAQEEPAKRAHIPGQPQVWRMYGRPRGRPPQLPQSEHRDEIPTTCSPSASACGAATAAQPGDFRSCPRPYWDALHAEAVWGCRRSSAVALPRSPQLSPLVATADADVEPNRFDPEPDSLQDSVTERPHSSSVHTEFRTHRPSDSEQSGDEESAVEEHEEAEVDDDEVGVGFFISTGGALGPVPEEESADFDGKELGPSSPLRDYVAATGALVKPASPDDADAKNAAARQIQRVFRRLKATQSQSEPSIEPMPTSEPMLELAEGPESTGVQDQNLEEATMESKQESELTSNMGEPAESDILRARLEAQQLLMPMVLRALLVVQATEAERAAAIPSDSSQSTVETCNEENLQTSCPPQSAEDTISELPGTETVVSVQANCPPQGAEETISELLDTMAVVGVQEEECAATAASEPIEAVPTTPREAELQSHSTNPEPAPPVRSGCCNESEKTRCARGAKPPARRVPAVGKQPAHGEGSAAQGTGQGVNASQRTPGRRLVCTRRRGPQSATCPRQPPPRPEKRPPVPRAPRPVQKESKPKGVPQSEKKTASPEEDQPASTCSPEEQQPADKPVGEAETAPDDIPCYEVSEEEFARLLQAGAVEDPTTLAGEDANEGDGAPHDFYEITEEEFERLMQAGQLVSAEEFACAPAMSSYAMQQGGQVDSYGAYDVSDAQFQQLLYAGVLQPDLAGFAHVAQGSACCTPEQPTGNEQYDYQAAGSGDWQYQEVEANFDEELVAETDRCTSESPVEVPTPSRSAPAGSSGESKAGSSRPGSGARRRRRPASADGGKERRSKGHSGGGGLLFMPTDLAPRGKRSPDEQVAEPVSLGRLLCEDADDDLRDPCWNGSLENMHQGQVAAGNPIHSASFLHDLRTPPPPFSELARSPPMPPDTGSTPDPFQDSIRSRRRPLGLPRAPPGRLPRISPSHAGTRALSNPAIPGSKAFAGSPSLQIVPGTKSKTPSPEESDWDDLRGGLTTMLPLRGLSTRRSPAPPRKLAPLAL